MDSIEISREITGARDAALSFLALLDKIASERSWYADAKCADADPDLFFPRQGVLPTKAKEICAACPVLEQCFEASQDERYGVWAGLSVEERREFRRRRDRRAR